MKLFGLRTGLVKTGDDLAKLALEALHAQKLQIEENDVLAFASKIVSISEGRIANLSRVKPTKEAKRLARKHNLPQRFTQLVLDEADKICGGVAKAMLTFKNGALSPNAGVDNKNSPKGFVALWPTNPKKSAQGIREEIKRKTGKRIGVIIVDSGLTPLRIGTTGLALAVAGFKPIRDHRGSKDLYGKAIMITRHAIADDLACAAHLIMGESNERTPLVLIKDATLDYDDDAYGPSDMMIPAKECIFMGTWSEDYHV